VPQPLRIAYFQAPVPRLPAAERLLAYARLPAQLRRCHAGFRLLQDPHNLLLGVSALPHLKSSSSGPHGPNLSETLAPAGLIGKMQLNTFCAGKVKDWKRRVSISANQIFDEEKISALLVVPVGGDSIPH
jgi:hypothetical protein